MVFSSITFDKCSKLTVYLCKNVNFLIFMLFHTVCGAFCVLCNAMDLIIYLNTHLTCDACVFSDLHYIAVMKLKIRRTPGNISLINIASKHVGMFWISHNFMHIFYKCCNKLKYGVKSSVRSRFVI